MKADLDWSDVEADAERCHDEDLDRVVWHENCTLCGPMGPITEAEADMQAYFESLEVSA